MRRELKRVQNSAGMTLVEVMLVMAIFGIVSTMGIGFLNSAMVHLNEQTQGMEGNSSIQWALHWLSRDLRFGKNIRIINENRVECEIMVCEEAGINSWKTIAYYLTPDGTLQRKENLDIKPLASGIEQFKITFGSKADSAVKPIQIRIKQAGHRRNSQPFVEFQTEIIPRGNIP
ncbi:prepilin-type N-terminal cleavage/methylation domain-containing protein [Heliobacillus mobilis]|uniref:Prepilin-type N-terminal cleavage/methylation domain-containing protein n=1 Tax=Heliobacterium mobile TaxID=28064 RepID=A0A6I3SKY9_HELMO|nr:prepilin-type N-terminal cleavage/methylation domain-containing protein [Heliobacterium mobile]MTV49352.1 prepilin-type N-terminal cleavage/methylation domain-containing protein [Heliobacterium mobile]